MTFKSKTSCEHFLRPKVNGIKRVKLKRCVKGVVLGGGSGAGIEISPPLIQNETDLEVTQP